MRYLLLLLVTCCAVPAISQTYLSPPFEGKATAMVDIYKIEITKKYTIVYMSCTTPKEFAEGGWACISLGTYIEDVDKKKRYEMIKSKGIPYCPNKYRFTGSAQTIKFKLYFPKLRYSVRHIHVVEDVKELQNPFNFYNIYLEPLAN